MVFFHPRHISQMLMVLNFTKSVCNINICVNITFDNDTISTFESLWDYIYLQTLAKHRATLLEVTFAP